MNFSHPSLNQGAASPKPRRVIGPIPPRDKHGKLMIPPVPATRVWTNALGEPLRDKDGHPVEETYDARDPIEYRVYELGQTPADGATKGLKLFRVDLKPEPVCLVYAKNEDDAVKSAGRGERSRQG